MLFEFLNDLCNSRLFLTDRHIDTCNILAFLIDNRIDRNSCFTGLSVTDNQLSLTSTDRNQCIDGFDTGLQRFMNRFSCHNTGCFFLNKSMFGCFDITFTVDRFTKWVNNTADKIVTDRYFQKTSQSFYTAALFDLSAFTEYNDTDN